MTELKQIADVLLDGAELEPQAIDLDFGRCSIRVLSNSVPLNNRLREYFSHSVIVDNSSDCDVEIIAIEKDSVDLPIDFKDWQREPGKTGRKDSYYDVEGGRLIRKVRTGMVFLQSERHRIVAGPCLENDNQVINFINNQYMTWLQQRDWLNCHAAALVKDGYAYAVAGFSGGGKSTLMLQMLEDDSTHFLSNDRLFIRQEGDQLQAAGVAKMPRINPGTIIHNPRLENMIPEQERQHLLALPPQELWDLEQKYDVDIDTVYGHRRIMNEAPLKSFLILNWQRDSDQPLKLKKINLQQRPDLLSAIMKSAGPFYFHRDGTFETDQYCFDDDAYLNALALIDVFEATGKVDFATLAHNYLMQREF
jgi:HprK-related kinase B